MGDKLFLNFGAKLRLSAKKNDEKCYEWWCQRKSSSSKRRFTKPKNKKDNLKMDSNRRFVEKFRNLST